MRKRTEDVNRDRYRRILRRVWMRQTPRDRSLAPPVGTLLPAYRWVCACGARGLDGQFNRSDVEYHAQRHQWRKGAGHPMPEIQQYRGRWGAR